MGRSGQKPLIEKLLISDIAAEGKAIARYEGMVVFVTHCVPGDIVDVQIVRKRKRFMEGYPVKFHTYSENRSKPFCKHFGICGGCKWQHLPYAEQLKFKQRQVSEMLVRIGKVPAGNIIPILASEKQVAYRNKLEFTFSDSRWLTDDEIHSDVQNIERKGLGFHIPGKFDKVLNIEECYLQPEPSNQIREFVREYAFEKNLEFFNLINHKGLLRNLIIRNNLDGEVMVIVSFYRDAPEIILPMLDAIADRFPQIVSLMYVINGKANDTLNDLEVKLFKGNDHLVEKMEDLRFRISPKSFFQTNTTQAYRLYSVVREFAQFDGTETVYDLYTGTGTIALFVARSCNGVVGLEYVKEAVDDAIKNAEINNIHNARFYAGDIRELLNDMFLNENGHPDVIITDPPRTGMHPDVAETILKTAPRKIVYVSCNPATQARDIEILSRRYVLVKSQPVDMFPFTHHVENVALLELINNSS
ncbi:MAG TPA: 23S rRNA (uracil(1939)-C(5))-methyltransferase RlmD [Bacteroidales bacterium]|jgi:23S rRNA (uracil1939-C5)-methyltransferase|nr:23S rRNA (uracil(1939)-C(5))-methyltransferase RlmD [Bacteroidales bacterium]